MLEWLLIYIQPLLRQKLLVQQLNIMKQIPIFKSQDDFPIYHTAFLHHTIEIESAPFVDAEKDAVIDVYGKS